MRRHVWPCTFCTFAEVDLPSDFGKYTGGLKRIIIHERKHVKEGK